MPMDFAGLAAHLLAGSRERLSEWFPAGKLRGREFQIGNLSGSEGDSLKVNVDTGAWCDFATGEKGGDLIALYAAAHGLDQGDAFRALSNGHFDAPLVARAPTPKAVKPDRKVVVPAPSEIESMRHPKFGDPSLSWRYADAEGRTLGHVARYDPPGERKQIVPWTYADGRWGMGQWLEPRPLYGLDVLAKLPSDRPVLIVEGEKAADAAREIVGDRYAVVTWPGGSQAWRKVDWSPVGGRRVLLWADADKKTWKEEEATRGDVALEFVGTLKPEHLQPGYGCMLEIADHLRESAADVRLIAVADAGPGNDGWDAADALAEGWDWPKLKAWAKERARGVGETFHVEPPAAQEAPQRALEPEVVPEPPAEPEPPAKTPKGGYFAWEGRIWSASLIVTEKGSPKPILENCLRVLSMDPEWAGVLAHDSFAMQTHARKPPPINGGKIGPWSDIYDINTAAWFQRAGLIVTPLLAGQAIESIAHDAAFHPVRDYLQACRAAWDGQPRLDSWLAYYVGAKDAPYTKAIGAAFLVGAVARIMRPGVKLDTALILEGPQGKRKSMVFDVLFSPWFSDDVSELGSKDSKMEVAGAWGMELAELSQMNRGDLETTKAFITRRIDRFRPAYGKRVVERARQCVFGGTSNNSDYLKDDENRRFLPIRVGERIDIEGLRTAKDQLWGEAVHRFEAGEPWWIQDGEILEAARQQQELRRQGDEWENRIAEWLADQAAAPPSFVTIGSVLEGAMNLKADRWGQIEQLRVARILKKMGWTRYQKRVGNTRIWAYKLVTGDNTGDENDE